MPFFLPRCRFLRLVKFFATAMMLLHWTACLWALVPQLQDGLTWLDEDGHIATRGGGGGSFDRYVQSFECVPLVSRLSSGRPSSSASSSSSSASAPSSLISL